MDQQRFALYEQQMKQLQQQKGFNEPLFHTHYENGAYMLALEQLWLSLSMFEHLPTSTEKTAVLRSCVKVLLLLPSIPSFEQKLKAVIAHEVTNEAYELLSVAFYCLSFFALQRDELVFALRHAQSAYFYAQKLEQRELRCDAQLLLVFVTMKQGDVQGSDELIQKFNWYIENCIDAREMTFVYAMDAMMGLLKGHTKASYSKMKQLLDRFTLSDEVMYTSHLAYYFKLLLQMQPPTFEVLQLMRRCDDVLSRFQIELPLMHTIYEPNAQRFLQRALQLFAQQQIAEETHYICRLTMTTEAAPYVESCLALLQTYSIAACMHSLSPTELLLYTSSKARSIVQAKCKESEGQLQIAGDYSTTAAHTVFELYNGLYVSMDTSV